MPEARVSRMILNLTQHTATPEQITAGVTDLPAAQQAQLHALLTFDDLPTAADIADRAAAIAEPVYAFSRRESVERTGENGQVLKTAVFRHIGFIEA